MAGDGIPLEPLKYMTWELKVFIHCEGCKKKVKKVLHSIDGVYTIDIDPQQHKVVVTGNVEADVLIKKLLKAGKFAQLIAKSPEPKANGSGKSKNKKKPNEQKGDKTSNGDDAEGEEDSPEKSTENVEKDVGGDDLAASEEKGGENDEKGSVGENEEKGSGGENEEKGGGGGSGGSAGKKKKKKKGGNGNSAAGGGEGVKESVAAADTGAPAQEIIGQVVEQKNLNPPQALYGYPRAQNYFPPQPALGMSYSTAYPSGGSSVYAPPVYGYANSHLAAYHPPPPLSYPVSAFDKVDDEDDEKGCFIM